PPLRVHGARVPDLPPAHGAGRIAARMTAANHTALFLDQAQALFLDPALLGGKAANLAWLSREGLPVPRWWVLTTEAFRVLLDSNDLSAWIDAQLARIGTGEDSTLLEGVARDIQQRVLA